jgi:cell division protein FtsQ
MDGRGRLAQSLTWIARMLRGRGPVPAARRAAPAVRARAFTMPLLIPRFLQRSVAAIIKVRVPRGIGIAATVLIIVGGLVYGTVQGGHVPAVIAGLRDARDAAANAAGFRIATIAISGQRQVSREEVLTVAGVTGTSSLPFLDAEAARQRLKTNPWIADATVLKLYPDHLQIGVTEREAFALWQKDGRVAVIAADGTVLEPYAAPALMRLPLVVGKGAAAKAKSFLALLDRHPDMRDLVRASILVGDRRWNLRLKNGIDVRLPENGVEAALEQLIALDRDKKLLSRDVAVIDLRLRDRVTVRQSEAAAQARAEAMKDKRPKKKGGAA